jgi:hypothetical protein
VTSSPAVEILRTGAGALASGRSLEAMLQDLLPVVGRELGIDSAAVFVADPTGGLSIAASIGLGDPSGLAAAVRNPAHPVSRTLLDHRSTFDVTPMAPGGPALRSHLPLTVHRDGADMILGVLALAYDRPLDPEARSIVEAVADLIAVAVERDPRG